ncbi:hypothetical protein BJF78_08460 [Pseudonocardia sp. CNS-139]|nr:hypothetical protein BJF78_08460 [Pseudonocardia sp. CNS-139]
MTDLGEIRLVLAGVAEQIGSAYQHAGLARARIARGVRAGRAGGATTPPPLLPPRSGAAAEELDRGLGTISGAGAAVADITARM